MTKRWTLAMALCVALAFAFVAIARADSHPGTCGDYASANVTPAACVDSGQPPAVQCWSPCDKMDPGEWIPCDRGEWVPEHDDGCQSGGHPSGCCWDENRITYIYTNQCIACPGEPSRFQCDTPCTGSRQEWRQVVYSWNAPCGVDNPGPEDVCEW